MELEDSSLYREIMAVIQSGEKPVHFTYKLEFHANGKTVGVFKIISIDWIDDYENNYATELLLEIEMASGDYTYDIYPFQDNLEATLYKYPIGEASDVTNLDRVTQTERYTAVLKNKGNPAIESNHQNQPTREALNLTGFQPMTVQLVGKAIEQMRMISVGGIYRNVTAEEVLRSVLTTESAKVQVEKALIPQGVDMVPTANLKRREHIIIEDGCRLVTLPGYIHEKCGGVYSAGMGYYYLNNHWYLFPSYDPTRFKQASSTLTIINIPENKFPNVERTYRKSGNSTILLATGRVQFRDNSTVEQLNNGNGVRFADAGKVMDGFATVKGNKATAGRGGNNSEFIAVPRDNGNNYVRNAANNITANPLVEYSRLAARDGGVFSFVWENADRTILFPGMMAKVLYLQEGVIQELDGVLLKVHGFDQMDGMGGLTRRYQSRAFLSLFVKRPR
jgi:hypothetical protein